jgi:hypothetical protein
MINVKRATLYGVVAGIAWGLLHFAFVVAPDNDLPSKDAVQIVGLILGPVLGAVLWLGLIGFAYARSINHYNRIRGKRK